MSKKQQKLLDHLYKDIHSSVAFTSVEPLLREARQRDGKISRRMVKDYLAGQNVYTLHRPAVRKYRHMSTLTAGLHTEWQADLAVFDKLGRENGGYKYLLVCIDTLSRMLFVEPVKSKHAEKMIEAFKKLFARADVIPWKLITDEGKEFTAKRVQEYFKSIEMEHFSIYTSPKFHAGMAERANRSIKERLYRLFTERRTQKWVDVVQKIVEAINRSPNSSIGGMRPMDVTYENAEKLRLFLKNKAINGEGRRRSHFNVGDRVRIEKYKHVFQKGYLPNFTSEIFIVDHVRRVPYQPVTYRIRDQQGEQIHGWFYANDLCLVKGGEERSRGEIFDIEKVLGKKRRDGVEYLLVKWKGYGAEHNSWIPSSSLLWK